MEIPALQKTISASDIPLERLAGNTQLTEEQKVAEASRQFEAVLLRQILHDTQKTVFKSKYSDDSTAAGIYRDMVTSQLADSISKSGRFGLAKSFERQLTRQLRPASPAGHDLSAAGPTSPAGTAVARPGSRAAAEARKLNHESRFAGRITTNEHE